MIRIGGCALACAVTLVLAPPSHAASDAADRVIDKAVAAMGGAARIRAIRSLVLRGYHYEGSYRQEFSGSRTGKATMIRLRPNLRLVGCQPQVPGCDGQWGRIVESYDGNRGWELNWPRQRLVRTVNKAERALRCGAQFDPLFVDYRARGFKATYLGRRTLLGRRTIAVRIDPPDCPSETFYFDPGTYALVMQRLAIPVHARGDAVDAVRVNRDFTTVAGVRLPSRSEEVALSDGRVLGGGVWTSIEANTISSPALFAAPEVHPTGITAIVLSMLAGAAAGETPQTMMARYTAFRAGEAGARADVAYDMNWLGYELLKVDDYPAAIAVFGRMVAENPGSADAQDSLGDAYLQLGDRDHARTAFDGALAIDPARQETLRKRAGLGAAK